MPVMKAEKVNILLVDDQKARLLSYESILRDLDENLITAQSGEEALSLLMKHDFAVVLLDVSMPGMDGFETAAMIHDHPRFERIPIIFVTGVHDTEFDRLKGYKVGAVDYVSIPIVPEILRSKVSVLVELYCQRRQLEKLNAELAEANALLHAEKTRELEQANQRLQRVNKALEEADRHKDEFIAILAHELRNPLAPIRTAVDIMQMVPTDNQHLIRARDVIRRQSTHLARLVDDLLDVSRITRGTINLQREQIDVRTLVSRSIEAAQPIIDERRHRLDLLDFDGEAAIEGDMTRLVQVLSNLLNNAAKYMNPGGRIRMETRVEGNAVVFRICDQGIGIESAAIPKLFTLFSRIGNEGSLTQGGLGIGLALVRQLVSLHGGTVSVESEGLQRGSVFTVRLPLSQHEPPRAEALDDAAEPDANASGLRILIADDNIDALDTLAMMFEVAGYKVRKANDGMQACKEAATWRPHFMLLDIGMPLMNGYDVARTVRAEPWGEALTLIAISGWGQPQDRERAFTAGFDAHFAKPVSFDTLVEMIKSPPPAAAREQRARAGVNSKEGS
ncbi:MAG TPA: response regulator [Pseudomonadales bacterium]